MSWMQTYTGKRFDFHRARLEDINIQDIAHHLSLLCRFNGATSRFYSVAQHSLYVSYFAPKKFHLWGLLHDAAEAYVGDVINPIKQLDEYDELRVVEKKIEVTIWRRFGLLGLDEPNLGIPPEVRAVDLAMCLTEGKQLLGSTKDWGLSGKALAVTILPYSPAEAERVFLERYEELHED